MSHHLPTWHETSFRRATGQAMTPLEHFVHEHEPAGADDAETFRRDLLAALNHAVETSVWNGERVYSEPRDPVYGSLTEDQKRRYYNIEEMRNRGN